MKINHLARACSTPSGFIKHGVCVRSLIVFRNRNTSNGKKLANPVEEGICIDVSEVSIFNNHPFDTRPMGPR